MNEENEMFNDSDLISRVKNFVETDKLVPESDICLIIENLKNVLVEEPNILELQSPITVCGDIHAQLHDLYELFKAGGSPSSTQYLFLGDYVDRGLYSMNTFLYLACIKILYPNNIYLLRGNHETPVINIVYGFYDECMARYGNSAVWKEMNSVFNFLPVIAIISNRFFCVHGGIAPQICFTEQVNEFDRFVEVPTTDCAFTSLLWDDPNSLHNAWEINKRGSGWYFGEKQVQEFLRNNNLQMIIRAHEVKKNGFEKRFDPINSEYDCSFITIWSAPNYNHQNDVKSDILFIDGDFQINFVSFDGAPSPKEPDSSILSLPSYFH